MIDSMIRKPVSEKPTNTFEESINCCLFHVAKKMAAQKTFVEEFVADEFYQTQSRMKSKLAGRKIVLDNEVTKIGSRRVVKVMTNIVQWLHT